MGRGATSNLSSSSIESSNYSDLSQLRRDLSTDLRLGFSIPTSQQDSYPSTHREQISDWPTPMNQLLIRKALTAEESECDSAAAAATFFVKVYMDGIPIGRKLDLLAHDGYHDLIRTLDCMFNTNILWAEMDGEYKEECHVLTYEDKEGDWLIVGDVPWDEQIEDHKGRQPMTSVS